MRLTNLLIIIIIMSGFLFNGCDYYDHRLEVLNYTRDTITVATYLDTVPDFPSLNKAEYYLREKIAPNAMIELTKSGTNGWSFFIEKSANRKLNLIVYKVDQLRKYQSIDTLIDNRNYDRFEFSKEELEDRNWKIVIK